MNLGFVGIVSLKVNAVIVNDVEKGLVDISTGATTVSKWSCSN